MLPCRFHKRLLLTRRTNLSAIQYRFRPIHFLIVSVALPGFTHNKLSLYNKSLTSGQVGRHPASQTNCKLLHTIRSRPRSLHECPQCCLL
ncbi:hypothetical protein BS17DRAFT_57628 [Gyrodon lividus]|nr:hypothetical protein BS17DRAFT_57628 [Gyrodon lividus]